MSYYFCKYGKPVDGLVCFGCQHVCEDSAECLWRNREANGDWRRIDEQMNLRAQAGQGTNMPNRKGRM